MGERRHDPGDSNEVDNERFWAVDYTAHPMLDPEFASRSSRLLHFARMTFERMGNGEAAYCHETARLLQPLRGLVGKTADCQEHLQQIARYFRETDVYIDGAIGLLPPESREHLKTSATITRSNDLRELLDMAFKGAEPLQRFEAQRKLYLAQLLLDIDHSRHIQDGPRHMSYFEDLLRETLWRHTHQVHELEIGFHLADDGDSIEYTSRPNADDQLWKFQSFFLEMPHGDRKISLDILYYNCRFKRSVQPISFEIIDGKRRVLERERWRGMQRHRNGSILSKMIRRGINNPDEIADIIGAMFIVNDEEGLNDLLTLLDASIGNPFGWRNVTDTFRERLDGSDLNRHSGKGFRVFKGDVDILIPGVRENYPPYRFQVEIQIYTLESYLRTVCGAHEASHQALKERQFVYGLVPMIFPRQVYGADWLRLD